VDVTAKSRPARAVRRHADVARAVLRTSCAEEVFMRLLQVKRVCWCVLLLASAAGCEVLRDDVGTHKSPESVDAAASDAAAVDDAEGDERPRMRAQARDAGPSIAGRGGDSAPLAGQSGHGYDGGEGLPREAESTAVASPDPIPSGTTAQCAEVLAPPAEQCLSGDRAERNDESSPATLRLAPSCGYIVANLAANDEDAYAFTPEKSDPIRLELAYTTAGVSDLELMIRGADGQVLETLRGARTAPREDLTSIVQATAGARYAVRIAATSGKASCQSYALRADPSYCTDAYEDNDSLEHATDLSWNDEERALAEGTLSSNDHDFFEVVTVRADPVLLTGEYRAQPGSTIEVRRVTYDAAGSVVLDRVGDRDTEIETFSHWLQAKSKGTVLRTRLWPSGSGCAPYKITFDARACTDAYEDNDTAAEASLLPTGRDVEVTGFDGDDDHYRIDGLAAGGTCVIRYTVPAGRSQQMRSEVYNVAGSQVTNALGGELVGSERQLRLSWAGDRGVATIRVHPDNGGYCQPYTIRCEPSAGQ
jgi:hypothetical protein